MLIYYHGTDGKSAQSILQSGANIDYGSGELGKGFYIGSSIWRAFSWAWHKAKEKKSSDYGVIEYHVNEEDFLQLKVLCKNRQSVESTFAYLRQTNQEKSKVFGNDAIWGPLVGKNIKDTYQIKFESPKGKEFINSQNKRILWP